MIGNILGWVKGLFVNKELELELGAELKVGDKVRIVKSEYPRSEAYSDRQGSITSLDSSDDLIYVQLDGYGHSLWYEPLSLEIITEEASVQEEVSEDTVKSGDKFKVNDVVVIINPSDTFGLDAYQHHGEAGVITQSEFNGKILVECTWCDSTETVELYFCEDELEKIGVL